MMDSYAYLHLALSHENPPSLPLTNSAGIRWKKLSGQAYRGFLSLAVTIAVLSVAQAAQALLAIGDFGEDVTRIQSRLSELGYFTANTTGYFGDITQNAVIQFQQDNGLVQDGIVGPNTLAAMGLATSAPADPTPPASDRDLIGLGFGDSGPGVRDLQTRLRSLGYFTANTTGYFGDITRDAVIQFQRDNLIAATGLVSEETLMLLNGTMRPENISLGLGSSGPLVGLVQRELRQLGYFNGSITNVFDQTTARAVRNFQLANGLPPTGRVETTTQALLVGWGGFFPNPSPVPNNPSNPSQILVVGSRGTAVILLQQRLQRLGYYTGTIDGIFDNSTRLAVIRFQRAYGITPTGQVGPTTQFYLARIASQPPAIAAAPPMPIVMARPMVTPIPQVSAVTVRPMRTPSTSLTVGDTGMGVRRIQRRLRELNFYDGAIDGFFDRATQNAVLRFQEANGITTTGIVGPTTESYMFNLNRRSFGSITTPVTTRPAETQPETRMSGVTRSGQTRSSGSSETPVNVTALQERLKTQGLYSGPVNGVYDSQTEAAVAEAREVYGASADDILYGGL